MSGPFEMSGQASASKQESPLQELEKAVTVLTSGVEELEQKMNHLIRPGAEVPNNKQVSERSGSIASDTIRGCAAQVYALRGRIASLAHRLDV